MILAHFEQNLKQSACFSWHLQKLLWRAQAYTYSSFLTVVWGLPQPLGCNVSNAPTMGGQGSGPWGLIGYTTIDQRSAPWCLLLLGLLILRNSCMHRKWGVKNVPHKSTTLSSCSYIYILLNQQQPSRWTTTIIYLFFFTHQIFFAFGSGKRKELFFRFKDLICMYIELCVYSILQCMNNGNHRWGMKNNFLQGSSAYFQNTT